MHRRILKLMPVFILAGMMFTACGKSGEIKIDKTESGYFAENTEEAEKETEVVPETVEQQLTVSKGFAEMAVNGTFPREELETMGSDELAVLYVRAVALPLCETDEEKEASLRSFVEMYSQEPAEGEGLESLYNKAVELMKAQIDGSNLGRQECIDVLVMQAEAPEEEVLPVNEEPTSSTEVSEEYIESVTANVSDNAATE